MNILIFPSWYSTKSNPTAGSFFKEQGLALKKAGHSVFVVYCHTLGLSEIKGNQLYCVEEKNDEGLDTYKIFIPSFSSVKRQTYFERCERYYEKLVRLVFKKVKIDLFYAFSYRPAGYCACRIGEKMGVPVMYQEHFSGVTKPMSEYYMSAFKYTMSKAKVVTSVSEFLKKNMLEKYGIKKEVNVLPNILSNNFHLNREKSNCFNIVAVGNLVPLKKHDLTIRAFAECFKGEKQYKLYIVGQGTEYINLKTLSDILGISEQVVFCGRLDRNEVAALLNKAQLYVLPSEVETFGVSYIEALACGVPTIGTKNGGYEEIYKSNMGYLIDRDDIVALKYAMKDAAENINRYNRVEISNYAITTYGEEAYLKQIRRYIEEAIG